MESINYTDFFQGKTPFTCNEEYSMIYAHYQLISTLQTTDTISRCGVCIKGKMYTISGVPKSPKTLKYILDSARARGDWDGQ